MTNQNGEEVSDELKNCLSLLSELNNDQSKTIERLERLNHSIGILAGTLESIDITLQNLITVIRSR